MYNGGIQRGSSEDSTTSLDNDAPLDRVDNYPSEALGEVTQGAERIAYHNKKPIKLFRETALRLCQALNQAVPPSSDTNNKPATNRDGVQISHDLLKQLPAPDTESNSVFADRLVKNIKDDPKTLASVATANYLLCAKGVDEKKVHSFAYKKASEGNYKLTRLVCSATNKIAVKAGNLFSQDPKYIKHSVSMRKEAVKRTSKAFRNEITKNSTNLREVINRNIEIFGSFTKPDNDERFELRTGLDNSDLSPDQKVALKNLIAYSQILVASLDKVDFQDESEIGKAAKTLMELPIKKADRLVTESFQKWMEALNTLCKYRLPETIPLAENNNAQEIAQSNEAAELIEEEKSEFNQPIHERSQPPAPRSTGAESDSESSKPTSPMLTNMDQGSSNSGSDTVTAKLTEEKTEESAPIPEHNNVAKKESSWKTESTRPAEWPTQARPQQNGLLRPLLDLIQECLPFGATNNYEPTGEGEPLNNQPLSDAEPLLGHSWYENFGKLLTGCISDETPRANAHLEKPEYPTE